MLQVSKIDFVIICQRKLESFFFDQNYLMEKELERLQLAIEKTGLSLALNQDDMVTGRLNEILEMLEKMPRESKFIPQNMIE